jgi:uncharacterized secreted protein with C-terminal beta-propeller domain
MKNKNLVLLGFLFVSSILLAGATVGISSMLLDMGNSNYYQDGRDLDAIPPTLTVGGDDTREGFEIDSKESEENESFVSEEMKIDEDSTVENFESFGEFKSFIENHTYQVTYLYYRSAFDSNISGTANMDAPNLSKVSADSDGAIDHSETNTQVRGVDEGDIIKNDGNYAYIVTNNHGSIVIVRIHPTVDAEIVSKIDVKGNIREIYIHGDLLVVLGHKSSGGLFVYVFDVADRQNPGLAGKIYHKASITDSRMIGDYLYLIASQYVNSQVTEQDLTVSADQIYYFSDFNYTTNQYSMPLSSIISINVTDPYLTPNLQTVLMGRSQTIYVSQNNIYVTYTKWDNNGRYSYSNQKTQIHRISIDNGSIVIKAQGNVDGSVLNRFSMDEHEDHFRMAVTIGWQSSHSVYVLDMDLNIVGQVDDIAPNERLYSARFMGNRAYLVTFKKVDPFFVIDLSNPSSPSVLGELKIPGYSDYLHPYDENHVIGLGKDTYDMGSFAWYQGVKLSLFDVSDVNNPKEKAKFIIGDRGTYSPAQHDPHAFLFDKNKNLLVIPIALYEINETNNPNPGPSTHGEFTWQGAYVFDISEEYGFCLKGRITHRDENSDQVGKRSIWYNYSSSDSIKRSFYIEDVLYTFSDSKLKANHLVDLCELNTIDLPDSNNSEEIYISNPIRLIP